MTWWNSRVSYSFGQHGSGVPPVQTFSVSQSRPRLVYNSLARLGQGQGFYNAAPLTPPATDLVAYSDAGYQNFFVAVCGSGANQATAINNCINTVIGETDFNLSQSKKLGVLTNWAYIGTPGGNPGGLPSLQGVGAFSGDLRGATVSSDSYRWYDWVPYAFDASYASMTPTQRSKAMNGWSTTWPGQWAVNLTSPFVANPAGVLVVNPTGGGASGGNLAAGTYRAAYAFETNSGNTRFGSSESAQFTVSAGNIPQTTLPAVPANATGISVYLTQPGGALNSEVLYATGQLAGLFNFTNAIPNNPGITVNIPGYTTLVEFFRTQKTWGNIGFPPGQGNNYYQGYWRNELAWMLAIWYEDPTEAQSNIYPYSLGDPGSPSSRVADYQTYLTTLAGQNGFPAEGVEYGRDSFFYPLLSWFSLIPCGRNLFDETKFHEQANETIRYMTSGQRMTGDAGKVYFQIPPWADVETGGGYTQVENAVPGQGPDPGSSFEYGDFYTFEAVLRNSPLQYQANVAGRYARQWLADVPARVRTIPASLDGGGSALDYRTAGLPRRKRLMGYDGILSRMGAGGGWDGNESALFIQGGVLQQGISHRHCDNGSWQWFRKGRWLTKESSGNSVRYASPRLQAVVGASPAPTTTSFFVSGLTSTVNWFSGSGKSVLFLTGALAGTQVVLTSYDGAGNFVMPAQASAPAAGDKVNLIDCGGTNQTKNHVNAASHNGLYVGREGFAGGEDFFAPQNWTSNPQTQFYTSYPSGYFSCGMDLSGAYISGSAQSTGKVAYALNVGREFYGFDKMEVLVILDRIVTQDFGGNSTYPQWLGVNCPRTLFCHVPQNPTLNPADVSMTNVDQTLRGFILRPSSPSIYATATNDFIGTKQSDSSWYFWRVEVQDNPGATQSYFMSVWQARDSSGVDCVPMITAEDSNTWTLSVTHATLGTITMTLKKGATVTAASEATGVVIT